MTRQDPHFRLRIPEDLKKQIENAARANARSINAEIVSRLERSLALTDKRDFAAEIEDICERLARLRDAELARTSE